MSLGEAIKQLKIQGLSYNAIKKKLGCSKGTISYYLGDGQKFKTAGRRRTMRKNNPLRVKMEAFKYGRKKQLKELKESLDEIKIVLRDKMNKFSRMGTKSKREGYKFMFNFDDLEKKMKDNPRCYWTGEEINLEDRTAYSLNHLIPKSRGGDNSLDNCVLTTQRSNYAQGDQLPEEFVPMCCKVSALHGKKILADMLKNDPEFLEMIRA